MTKQTKEQRLKEYKAGDVVESGGRRYVCVQGARVSGTDRRIKLTPKDLAWIQRQRKAGKTLTWACAVVGVDMSTVTRRLAKQRQALPEVSK